MPSAKQGKRLSHKESDLVTPPYKRIPFTLRGGVTNIDEILRFIWSVDEDNCKRRTHEELHLKGDISWGAEWQFENEALMAVRLANFISSFLQVVDPKEVFPGTRVVDKPLTEDQV
jgi:hypothetical protein